MEKYRKLIGTRLIEALQNNPDSLRIERNFITDIATKIQYCVASEYWKVKVWANGAGSCKLGFLQSFRIRGLAKRIRYRQYQLATHKTIEKILELQGAAQDDRD